MTVPVFVDVDGVINAFPDSPADLAHWPAETWRKDLIPMASLATTLEINWSTAVIERLRAIEALPGVEMVWCTTWLQHAPELLALVVGLGQEWPVARPVEVQGDVWITWWKANRVFEAVQKHGRAVWIDDDITAWGDLQRHFGRPDKLAWIDDRILAVSPSTSRGLTAKELTAIERFLT